MNKRSRRPRVRQGQPAAKLSLSEFSERFHARFRDPAFGGKSQQIEQLLEVAWDGYRNARKSPITRKAGNSFADPDYDLSVDWLRARAAIRKAQRNHDRSAHARILLICGAARNDKSCPGEMSKTNRMAMLARTIFENHRAEVDVLDLSLLTSEYGRVIYPYKGGSERAEAHDG